MKGNLWVTGPVHDGAGIWRYITRLSTDSGVTWTTSDDFAISPGVNSVPSGIGLDANNNVMTCGWYTAGAGYNSIIRSSTNLGTSWSTILDYTYPTGNSVMIEVRTDRSGNWYAIGKGAAGGKFHLLVFRSKNQGATWTLVDDYQYVANHDTNPTYHGFVQDLNGALYVTGYGDDAGGVSHWITRKSVDGGDSWSTVDDYQYVSGYSSSARSLAIDRDGNVYAVGLGKDAAGNGHWIVRRSLDAGVTWATTDDYRYPTPGTSGCNAVAVATDLANNLYVTGCQMDSGGKAHWLVRKMACGF